MENIYTDDKFDLGVKGLNQQHDALDPINSYRKESNIIQIINCDKLFQICEFFYYFIILFNYIILLFIFIILIFFIFSGTWYVKIHTKWI